MKIFWEVCNNNNNMFDFIALLHICSWGLSESHSTLARPAPTMYELLCSCVLYISHESCSSTAGVCLSLCGSAPLCLSFSHQAFFTSVGLLYLSLPFRLFELKVWSLHVFLLFHCQFTKQLLFYFLKSIRWIWHVWSQICFLCPSPRSMQPLDLINIITCCFWSDCNPALYPSSLNSAILSAHLSYSRRELKIKGQSHVSFQSVHMNT